ncbi:hypothetical protein H257_16345 [Aphanomyces astaci]|uniref:Vacuolar protein sorting-associated protein 51 homolog n=1 Tax=Aphanomyces astaci TaxID=112090 RepID=W4FKX4_APHAT|nr:hypothetical protein H257_16345 [Aphanomyces astaci]ETV67484.1 hypothetical protein H257_16345 [Aphanomyces astaci]|eukprot:XP_009843043.1 hypothetical protein H257_16345 [Aphanomyces astaci]
MESRMQELMSSYYDLSDKDETVSQSKNINAPGFLVDDYVKDMLESMGMDELLRRDDQMIKEIKELDTNMQMLVYENYNKFISATDTIRKMKTNVESMESEVKKVVDSMGKITVQSENVSNALAPFRSKVEKLVGVRRLLKRLEFIFQLPQRLKSAMKAQEYDKATKYFVVANRILKRYQHIASFKTIQLEAEHIMFGLRTIVQKKFDDDSTTAPQVQEYAALLLDLNVSVPEVRQRFLNWYQLHFDHFVATFQDTQPCDTVKYIDAINNAFLPSFATSATAFQAVFGRADVESTAAFGAVATVWFDGYASVCGVQFQRQLAQFTSGDKVGGSGGYGILMLMLKAVIDGIHSLTAPLLPTRDILARTSQLVEASIRFQVDAAFTLVKTEFVEKLITFHDTVQGNPRNMPELAKKLCTVYVDRIEQSLQRMQPLISTAAHVLPEMSRALSDLVQNRFKAFLDWFTSMVLRLIHPPSVEPTPEDVAMPTALAVTPPFLLLLACVCREFGATVVPRCIQVMVECLPNFNPLDPASSLRSAGTIVDVPTIDQLAKDTAMAFLHQFALLHSARLNTLLRTAVLTPNWLEANEPPRAVRPEIDAIVDEWVRVVKSTAEAFGEPVPGPSRINSTSGVRDLRWSKQPRSMGSGKQATNSGHMYMDVARLFAKKVHVYHGPDLAISVDSVLSCVFKIACKAYGEYARMATFGRFGVQQMQVDTEWLKVTAATYLTADSSVNEVESLLCDVVTNSMERAVEYTLLEESVLVAIVSTKKGTLKI